MRVSLPTSIFLSCHQKSRAFSHSALWLKSHTKRRPPSLAELENFERLRQTRSSQEWAAEGRRLFGYKDKVTKPPNPRRGKFPNLLALPKAYVPMSWDVSRTHNEKLKPYIEVATGMEQVGEDV
eukprot:NODE_5747_length_641_cov_33.206081_g2834_i1.p1 GENE.NODE_5747_length_641_cov_33.206081_g2834_i1~~NODE_5747_length_641_cov_33.206081_g2834_i1.p1  ORF type:complete len:144 (-),score=28.31 NODE_5747_length_641_cov_33.206081_g2834_i1:210-581(-)